MKWAIGSLLAVACAGCVNSTPFTRVPERKAPVAVIEVPPGVEAFVEYEASGEGSTDADGTVVEWEWRVLAKPAGSGFDLLDIATEPDRSRVRFRPDLIGTYRIELTVIDDDGLHSEPVQALFDVASSDGLRIELTWDVDISDVDLHLVNDQPGAAFFEEPNDCFFQNQSPDWGVPGSPDDDPYLPMDADDGFGPEIIGVRDPAAGAYRILSHYYCDDGFGGTTATLRVFVDGAPLLEAIAPLTRTGDLWEVGTLTLDTAGIPALVVSTGGITDSGRGCQ